MHIILNVLIKIGIIILIILGIVLALILLVLLVPIRYKASLKFPENNIEDGTEKEKIISGYNIKLKLRWLAGIVSFSIRASDGTDMVKKIRVLGIPIKKLSFGKKSKKKNEKHTVQKVTSEDNKSTDVSVQQNDYIDGPEEKVAPEKKRNSSKKKSAGKQSAKKMKSGLDRVKQIKEKIKSVFNEMGGAEILHLIKDILIRLLRHIKPKKIYVNMKIGTGDPCNTGMLFGGISMIMALWPGNYRFTPDFYNKGMEGQAYAKGHIRIIVLLYYTLKIIFDDNIRRLMGKKKKSKR